MKKYKKLLHYIIAFALTASYTLPVDIAHANSTKLYLATPSNVKVGDSFTVRVVADAGSSTGNRARIDLKYPSNKVQAVSTRLDNSVFGGFTYINNSYSANEGMITHLAYPIPAPQGQGLSVFTVSFNARETGQLNLSFDSDSVVNDSIPKKTAGSINVTPRSCPDGQTGTPPNCTVKQPPSNNKPTPAKPKPKPTPKPSPKPQVARPNPAKPTPNTRQQPAQIYPGRVIHPAIPVNPLPPESPSPPANPEITTPDIVNQQILDSELDIVTLRTATRINRAELIWELNHPSNTTFKYGSSADDLSKTASIKKESETRFYADIRDLDPGETYYYTIEGARTNGTEKMSQSGTFSTKGYGVELTALQQDGSPLTNAQISFEKTGGSVSTNEEGIAYIQVKDGSYNVNITKGGHSSTHSVVVEKRQIDNDGDAEVQKIELKTSATSTSSSEEPALKAPSAVAYIVTIMIGVIAMTVIGFIIYFRKRAMENKRNNTQSVVMIEDDWMPPPQN